MKFLITAGPTREYIDPVRFITNASSGRMGCEIARAAHRAGHEVTLLRGPGTVDAPESIRVERFCTVDDLRRLLDTHFPETDVLAMSAAVGDFTVDRPKDRKLPRAAGEVDLRLIPTADLLAELAGRKRPHQTTVSFAVETGCREAILDKARREMQRKGADFCVVNTPSAMGSDQSDACVLSTDAVVLPWANRTKTQLAEQLIALL